jgi:hypothetical protein
MNYLLVRHRVADFKKWKEVFDENMPLPVEASCGEGHVLVSKDNPLEIVVMFEVQDINQAREFMNSSDMRASMDKAGVIDEPSIYFLEEVAKVPAREFAGKATGSQTSRR